MDDVSNPQSSGPYAPPQVEVDPERGLTKRNPWIAVLLALSSPVYAMLYVARWRRALGYFAASLAVLALALVLNAFRGMSMNLAGGLGGIALGAVGVIDGYRCAKAWHGMRPLPWYARWPGLVSIVAFGILSVTALRAFVVEPFHIPSGSMIPTLVVGDYILVSKSAYGLRLPWSGRRFMGSGEPRRGDIAVFRYPENLEMSYVKRVVGVPGDRVSYIHKQLSINGKAVPVSALSDRPLAETGQDSWNTKEYVEELDGHRHPVLVHPDAQPVQLTAVRQFPHRDACEYDERGFVCTVPEGHYFTMGD